MNVVFISPHFPLYFHNFCSRLKNRGVNVLGIGDAQYSEISNETKESLSEYYRVNSLENYDEVYKAVAYYISMVELILLKVKMNIGWRLMHEFAVILIYAVVLNLKIWQ